MRPTNDDLFGLPISHPSIPSYDWVTKVRITEDGVTISEVRDILDVPHDAVWARDSFGGYAMTKVTVPEVRHPAVANFDARIWELLLGRHSARDEVKANKHGTPAAWIATMLIQEYPDHANLIMRDEDITQDELHASLTRSLLHDGGSAW
jgi:hypothetical protein